MADLVWHLTEVQHFWSAIVGGGLQSPEAVARLARPDDHGELMELCGMRSKALVEALRAADPDETVWTWSTEQSVAFILRRQAHEALIHRVDAELSASAQVGDADPSLALDGIDELLEVMVGSVPAWGRVEVDGDQVGIEATDQAGSWTVALGRFRGTSPQGKDYDLEGAVVQRGLGDCGLVVRGGAWPLDRWLWGRGGDDALAFEGDTDLAQRLRSLIAEATQ